MMQKYFDSKYFKELAAIPGAVDALTHLYSNYPTTRFSL
jgi:hypothetical protein